MRPVKLALTVLPAQTPVHLLASFATRVSLWAQVDAKPARLAVLSAPAPATAARQSTGTTCWRTQMALTTASGRSATARQRRVAPTLTLR